MSINRSSVDLRSILLYRHENTSRWCEFWHNLSTLWASGVIDEQSMGEASWLSEKASQFQISSNEVGELAQLLCTDVRSLCEILESISRNCSNAHELELYHDQLVAQDGQWEWNAEYQLYGRFVRGVWEWQPEASQPEASHAEASQPGSSDQLERLVPVVAAELGSITALRRAAPAERRELLALALARAVAADTETS